MRRKHGWTGIVLWVAVVAGLAMCAVPCADAALLFAGEWKDGEFAPDKDVKGRVFSVRYCTVSAEIADGKATTKIEENIVSKHGKTTRVVCLVPLPKGVSGESVTWSFVPQDIATGGGTCKYLDADAARAVYESIAKTTGSARILALSDRPAILATGTIGKKATLKVSFQQSPGRGDGLASYRCPLPATAFTFDPVERVTLNATVRSKLPLRAMFSPSHPAAVKRKGVHEATVRFTADRWSGPELFTLLYVADKDPLGLRVLTYRDESEEEGYFLAVANPTGSGGDEKPIEKDVVFVLDTSGSMRGEKMEQARSAVEYCLKNLNPGDRFNIVTFGTEVRSFRDDLVRRTDKTEAAARAFVDDIVAVGRTNIAGALAKGLAGAPRKGRPRIMIFLTDGTPTAGERVPDKIAESVPALNTSKTRVFVVGVGNDVNAHLLDRIAEDTDGSSEYLVENEEIDTKVAALYDRLSHPVLTNVRVAFNGLRTQSVYPKKLPALFKGTPIMIAGRYRDGGKHTVTIAGELAGETRDYTFKADFPATVTKTDPFVAPLWAARKIGFLLREIRLHGENKELIDEVVRLSARFGIVTEYTEFLAMSGKDMATEDVVKEAKKRLSAARAETSGQWAVNQAINERALQDACAPAGAAAYRDRRGQARTVANVRQIGGKAYYLRAGRWVDAEKAGDRKTRKIKAFSKEYFTLIRENEEFRKAQELDANVELNVGGERITVEK